MDLADEIYEMRNITYDEQITHLVGIVGQYSMQMTQNVKVDVVFSLKVLNLKKKLTTFHFIYFSYCIYHFQFKNNKIIISDSNEYFQL